jgi:CubicO group peptidase (beta-lactamase class C family)
MCFPINRDCGHFILSGDIPLMMLSRPCSITSDIPIRQYSNTVAYGMFAGEDLKDSLLNWTIDTKLRRKRNHYQEYDYKYSDLGFYLMQMVVERASGTTLDVYMDSLFYKPMGMGTMTYNPLVQISVEENNSN